MQHAHADNSAVLDIRELRTYFYTYEGIVEALNGVTFPVYGGEITGLVGETGSGKSVTGFSILQLVGPPGKIVGGEVLLGDRDLLQLSQAEMQNVRGCEISMIFQEPRLALNPLFKVGDQIARLLRIHGGFSKKDAWERGVDMLRSFGITDPERRANAYPHEISSGMCQRAMIAMALSANPKVLIADEPTTGLDVTVQAQVLDLIRELVLTSGSACVFITHDLGVIAELSDRVVVMYAGRVVEYGLVEGIFGAPRHPYTQALILSTLRVDIKKPIVSIPGVVPDALHLPPACTFHPRCAFAEPLCHEEEPNMTQIDDDHYARCHLASGGIDKEMPEEAWTELMAQGCGENE